MSPIGLLLALLLIISTASAQDNTRRQPTDSTQLTVRVTLPDGRIVTNTVIVQLDNASGVPLGNHATDYAGEAKFFPLSEGTYLVQVTGPSIEDTSRSVRVYLGQSNVLEIVQVKAKHAGPETQPSAADTVPVVDLNIPPKARKEFDRGTEAMARLDWSEARKRLDKAVEIYPDYADAYNNLGVIFMNTHEPQKAWAAFEKAVAINSSYGPGYLNLARIASSERKYDKAEDLLKAAVRVTPKNVEALYMLANVELRTGQYDDAIRDARAVHALPHEKFPSIHQVCGMALQATGRVQEAEEEYKQVLLEAPDGIAAADARRALQALQQASR